MPKKGNRKSNAMSQETRLVRSVLARLPKTKKRKSQRKRRTSNPSGIVQVGRYMSSELAQSWANPFDFSTCIPDGSSGTGCFSFKGINTFTTGSTGSCNAFALNNQPFALYDFDNGSTAATPTLTGNWVQPTSLTSMASFYSKYRPVSCGLRAAYTGPTQTDGGTVLVGQVSGGTPLSSFNGLTLGASAALTQYYKVFPLREGAIITWRPQDEDDCMQYQNLTSGAVAISAGQNTPYLILFVFGASSAQSTLTIEWVVNWEGQFENQAFLPGGINVSQRVAELGWYQRAKNLLINLDPISSFVNSPLTHAIVGGLTRTAANFLGPMTSNGNRSPGLLSASGLPMLTWPR